jgi:uncharacterized membrane protein YhhN
MNVPYRKHYCTNMARQFPMTGLSWGLLGLSAVFAAGDWVAVGRGARPLEYVCKPVATAGLVGVAAALTPAHGDTRAWFVAALVLSLAGDVFLMLTSGLFLAGLAAFLLGHVGYIVGLNLHGVGADAIAAAAVPVVVLGSALAIRFLRALARTGQQGLALPVVAYMAVISAMVTSALATGNAWAGAGAALFFVSDALIAETRFVRGESRAGRVAIMVTYHLAQAGLVISLLP